MEGPFRVVVFLGSQDLEFPQSLPAKHDLVNDASPGVTFDYRLKPALILITIYRRARTEGGIVQGLCSQQFFLNIIEGLNGRKATYRRRGLDPIQPSQRDLEHPSDLRARKDNTTRVLGIIAVARKQENRFFPVDNQNIKRQQPRHKFHVIAVPSLFIKVAKPLGTLAVIRQEPDDVDPLIKLLLHLLDVFDRRHFTTEVRDEYRVTGARNG